MAGDRKRRRNKRPFIAFYPDDWSAGVKLLPTVERALLHEICLVIWDKGKGVEIQDVPMLLPEPPERIQQAIATLLRLEKIEERDGRYVKDRALEEYQEAKNRSEAGRKAAEVRHGKNPIGDDAVGRPTGHAVEVNPQANRTCEPEVLNPTTTKTKEQNQKPNPEQEKQNPSGEVVRTTSRRRTEPKGGPAWEAYAGAYKRRYGVLPARNAKTNAHMVSLVGRLGVDDAPPVAAFYVQHNQQFYVTRGHPTDLLLRDAEKLRTEWATNRPVTDSMARQQDRSGTNEQNARDAARYRRQRQDTSLPPGGE